MPETSYVLVNMVRWISPTRQYAMFFLPDRLLLAKVGGLDATDEFSFGGYGEKDTYSIRKRDEKIEKALHSSPDEILRLNKNFELRYKDISKVELKRQKRMFESGELVIRMKERKYKFDIHFTENHARCVSLLAQYVGPKMSLV